MATYLAEILERHRAAAAIDRRDAAALIAQAEACGPGRGFRDALATHAAAHGLAVIAEVKRRSPSKGDLAPGLDPAAVAMDYVAGGATALSVLTDGPSFGGSAQDLIAARTAVGVPVLRKDFTVCPADVADARIMGADAVLLIVAALEDAELAKLHGLAVRLGLDALVEVHDEPELERALAAGATLVGVNQRDLTTFQVDTARAQRVGAAIPDGVVSVAESGISSPEEARRMADGGFHAVLVGETLVTAAERVDATRSLGGFPVAATRAGTGARGEAGARGGAGARRGAGAKAAAGAGASS